MRKIALALFLFPCSLSAQTYSISPCTAYTVATGGVANAAQKGPWNGIYIQNGITATDQAIGAAENLTVNVTTDGTPATAAANNETTVIVPGQAFFWGFAASTATLSVYAATTGHSFTCKVW